MLKGKTKSGFEFEINEKLLDNMELLELFAEIQTDDLKFPQLVKLFMGEEQKKKLYEHMRNKNGVVPIEKTMKEVLEIMRICKGEQQTKN